jgi:2-polyprenyl-6-methoxyphenol hydroxylase-like FAD-dependent oxidoreductase
MRVLIVGGGIAGLTLAIGLARKGVRADVVEIQPRWNVLGVGISLTGPTLRALRTIGLIDACVNAAYGFGRIVICDPRGAPIDAMVVPPLNGSDYPPMIAIGRPALHDVLLAALGRDQVKLGTTVTALDETAGGIDAAFSDGAGGRYDLVVGADGFHSRLRATHFPDAPKPRFTGLAVWRATMARRPEIDSMHMYYGPRNKAGLNPTSDKDMFLFLVQSIVDDRRLSPDEQLRVLRDELADYGGLLGEVRDGIVDPRRIDYRPMDALLVPPPWHRGRLLLIGDAMHTTTPHLATGAGIAIEDAVVLAEMLMSGEDVLDVLPRYAERRFPRCKLVVETSITLGEWEKDPAIPPADHVALMKRTFAALAQPI